MNWEEACQILGVPITAKAAEIQSQYIYKAQLLHPDKTIGLPETIRHKAEEELKLVNAAFMVIKDLKINPQNNPPKLNVSPKRIAFTDLGSGQKKTTIVKIASIGGAYTKFWMDDAPASWLKVIEVKSTTNDPLPLEVTLEATGNNKQAKCNLPIRIENEKTKTKDEVDLKIELYPGSPTSSNAKSGNSSQPSGKAQQMQKTPIVGICGRSCSGKGAATEALASNNRDVLLLQSDYYFLEKTPCSYKGYACWEHVNCIDFSRLIRDVESLRSGQGIVVKTPSWKSPEKVQITKEDLKNIKLIVIEGYLIFAVKQLADLFDYKIFVDSSDYTILKRRPMRDGFKVFNYVQDVVIPVSKEYERVQKDVADVIINGEKQRSEVVKDVSQLLQQKFSNVGFTPGQSPWKVSPRDLIQESVWHPIDFSDLKDWVKKEKKRLDSGDELKGRTFRYRKNLRTGIYEVRLSSSHQPRICRYTLEPT